MNTIYSADMWLFFILRMELQLAIIEKSVQNPKTVINVKKETIKKKKKKRVEERTEFVFKLWD